MSQKVYLAEEKDGEKILEILENSPAKGNIELLYTRRPNAYQSYKKEDKDSTVLVIKENEEIIATAAGIPRDVYIGGVPKKISYLCGLKKDKDYQGNVNWGKIFIKSLVKPDIDAYFCSIVTENKEAQKLFEKKRKRTLNMEYLQGYTTYILTPYFKFKIDNPEKYSFNQANKKDEKEILEFLNKEGRKKDFFPIFKSLDQFSNLSINDFYILRKDNEIVSVAALWKQFGYRQYVVKKYNGIMKFAKIFNPVLKGLGYIKLPKENETIKFPMLSFFISKDDNEEYYKVFLNNINPVIKEKYGMFVIGTIQSSYMNNIYKNLRNIHFDTRIYSINFIIGNGKEEKIDKDKLWLECALL